MAWARKILRVNLTAGTCTAEPLNMEWAREYLGQRGLATKYFTEEVDAKVDPLSPANKLICATGPAHRHHGLHRRPLLGDHQGPADRRHRLLQLGRLLRRRTEDGRLGHDHLRGQVGQAGLPADRGRQGRAARRRRLWGKSVWETEELLKKQHQDPQMRVSSIGRAGETGCLYAAVVNDLHRAAGRSGVGTVMG